MNGVLMKNSVIFGALLGAVFGALIGAAFGAIPSPQPSMEFLLV